MAMYLITFGSIPYCPANLSMNPFTTWEVSAVGVGTTVGFFVGIAVGFGVIVALGVAVISALGDAVGVRMALGVAVGVISTIGLTNPNTFFSGFLAVPINTTEIAMAKVSKMNFNLSTRKF
jgi:hypothetical protein